MIHIKYKNCLVGGIFALTSFFGVSCDDSESYDFGGTSETIVFVPTSTGKPAVTRVFDVLHTKAGSFGTLNYRFKAAVTSPISGEITLVTGIDNSLVSSFNEANKTNHQEIPIEAIELIHSTLTIPAGEYTSGELQVTVKLKEDLISTLKADSYILPIGITSVTSGNARLSQNRSIVYLQLSTTTDTDEIWEDQTPEGALMTIEERVGWSAMPSTNPSYAENSYLCLFDGNEGWFADSWNLLFENLTSNGVDVVVDLGKTYSDISGLHFNGPTDPYILYFSEDGVNWKEMGKTKSYVSDIAFYAKHTVRYIKINFLKPSYSSELIVYLLEFNLFQKLN